MLPGNARPNDVWQIWRLQNGLLKQLTKMLVERALETEMSEHLGHGKSEAVTNATGNTRNGHSAKTLQGGGGELPLNIPRDRQGAFEPKLVERHQRRWTGFDDILRGAPVADYTSPPTIRRVSSSIHAGDSPPSCAC
ncbi:mutator family transposase [Paraburkholderia sp. BL18I3N2]|nr:mutator family transposase [Paraburkholderia sp. BL18I3N2]TDY15663.1 mutator family transposase [Paraburkholderia sp. BL6665CI2N2]